MLRSLVVHYQLHGPVTAPATVLLRLYASLLAGVPRKPEVHAEDKGAGGKALSIASPDPMMSMVSTRLVLSTALTASTAAPCVASCSESPACSEAYSSVTALRNNFLVH